ncbi:hypothetical protein FH972_021416 [Carpinus fangiana]|uniref:Uncharacterized protein n=1 Tax=Carpinus fangiana TaxID=176857 RepID=A0A5N6KP98_9ROSI|nr:hypothetical protein FH972_021416 [Carpinus fangiana]
MPAARYAWVMSCPSLSFEYVLRQWSKRPVYDHARRRTVLITGVGMTKGLALARSFHAAGHRVIGADFEENGALVCGRVSRALASFYSLQNPSNRHGSSQYVKDLTRIIREEKIELWVSCSGVASAVEDGEAKEAIEKATTCRAVQFDVAQTSMLHEKHSFINKTHDLGLTVPHTFHVTDHTKAEKLLLDASRPEKYIMKCVGVDDSTRGDMTLLPCRDPQETRAHLAEMNISSENPWIIQQYIKAVCGLSLARVADALRSTSGRLTA